MTTTTALARPQIAAGVVESYEAFAHLVAALDDAQWNAPSRCDGWLVRDVAGHVIGLAEDVAKGTPGSRNSQEEAASVRGDSPTQAAARFHTAIVVAQALVTGADDATWAAEVLPEMTLGEGALTLWYDNYVHADDIRVAAGIPSVRDANLEGAIAYVANELAKRNYGPATLKFDGVGVYDIGGGGPVITGDAYTFLMAATGRADATTAGLEPDVNIYADA